MAAGGVYGSWDEKTEKYRETTESRDELPRATSERED
jgi:hypothetical protein